MNHGLGLWNFGIFNLGYRGVSWTIFTKCVNENQEQAMHETGSHANRKLKRAGVSG
jgi:hypothetical protein